MKSYLCGIVLIGLLFIQPVAKSETLGFLLLRAEVRPAVISTIEEIPMGSNQSLWRISNQSNSKISLEGQTFEVEGLDQKNLDSNVRKIITKDNKVQIEILINSLQVTSSKNHPIFLKITAN